MIIYNDNKNDSLNKVPDDDNDDCNNDNDVIGSLNGFGPFHLPVIIVVHLSISIKDGDDNDNNINCNNNITINIFVIIITNDYNYIIKLE